MKLRDKKDVLKIVVVLLTLIIVTFSVSGNTVSDMAWLLVLVFFSVAIATPMVILVLYRLKRRKTKRSHKAR